jgi:transposase InsO family protein
VPIGFDYVHVAIDDHSRLAYVEVLPDERANACAGFLTRAVAWFAARDVTVARVLTDNALSYRRGSAWGAVCTEFGIGRRFIQPGRPWTNGKAERFNRTLRTEWAHSTGWTSNDQRTAALDSWLEHYNTARSHSALGGQPPISRVTVNDLVGPEQLIWGSLLSRDVRLGPPDKAVGGWSVTCGPAEAEAMRLS